MAKSIDDTDLTSIQQYGVEVSKTIEDNGDSLLDSIRSNNNNNEANMLINNLLAELKMVDTNDLQSTKIDHNDYVLENTGSLEEWEDSIVWFIKELKREKWESHI